MDAVERLARAILPHAGKVAGAAVAGVITTMVIKAYMAGKGSTSGASTDPEVVGIIAELVANKEELAEHLKAAIQLRTISFEDAGGNRVSLLSSAAEGADAAPQRVGCACCGTAPPSAPSSGDRSGAGDAVTSPTPEARAQSRAALLKMQELLAATYPNMHTALERHVVNELSLLYVWRGSQDAGAESPLAPIGFAAHMDVVPVPDAAEWKYPPFSGTIADGYVWGRGAIDDKQSVVGLCEAVEALARKGWRPNRTILFLFGHDEEIGGNDGAAALAAALPSHLNGSKLAWLLDEGLFLLSDFFPGVAAPVAAVCTSEKGHVNAQLSVSMPAGHSSVPPETTAIGVLARAVARLEASPFPAHMQPAGQLFDALLPAMTLFPYRLLFANAWITAPLLRAIMLRNPRSAALLRTTTAVTMTSGGLKSNVLPPLATALVNHRIHPAESVASVLARDRAVIGDPRVTVTAMEPLEPAPVSSTGTAGYQLIATAVKTAFGPGTASTPAAAASTLEPVVAPGMMLGNTDTKWYWQRAAAIYRHCPTQLRGEETAMFHGRDERIRIENLARIAGFYAALMVLANKD